MNKTREIFSQIYDQYVNRIYRFIFLKVNSQEIAEDLCSETFLKGWQCFKDNKKDIENPQAFLYQIARNLVIDYYRGKGRTQTVSADYLTIADPRIDLEAETMNNSDLNKIRSALVNIKNDYQEAIIWHYIDDLSIKEIAGITGKTEGAVRVMLHRALKSLKNRLSDTSVTQS